MNKIIFLILLLPGLAFGASSRVLPASYTEYTYDSAGGGEDYTSLATWEADTDIDVSVTGQVLTCSAGIHNDSVTLAGATADSDGFRVIRAAGGARGTPTSGVRFVNAATAAATPMNIEETYARMYDIASKITVRGGNYYAIAFRSTSAYTGFAGCIAYYCVGAGTSYAVGFLLGEANPMYAIDCVAKNMTGGSGSFAHAGIRVTGGAVGYLYNCTVVDCTYYGIEAYTVTGQTTTIYLKNTISQNNGTNIGGYGSGTENIYQTTNATSGVTFVIDGYHLDSTDTAAINNGTDLSANAIFAFDDDVDGETRDDWDIGCDEYVSGEPPAARRRIIMVQ
jgi:hypothetical protein